MRNIIHSSLRTMGVSTSGVGMKFLRDTSIVSMANILQAVLSYFIVVLISRNLGAEGFGQYSFIFSFAVMFFIFADMGMSTLLVKDFPSRKEEQERYLSNIISFKSLLGGAIFLVFVGASFMTGKQGLLVAMAFAGATQFLSSMALVLSSVLRAKSDSKRMAYAILIERFIAMAGALVILPLTRSLDVFVALLAFSMACYLIYLLIFIRRSFRMRFSLNRPFLKGYLRRSLPFFGVKVSSLIYIRLDTVMLSLMVSDTVVGWYNAPYKIIDLLNLFPSLLLIFGFPLFAKLKKKVALNKKLLRALLFSCVSFSLPVIVGVWFIGDRVLEFIYRFGSVESFIAFKILVVAQLFIALSIVMGYFIAATQHQRTFALISGIGAVLNLSLNFILIPRYSLFGAGIATLATYIFIVIALGFLIRRDIGSLVPVNLLLPPLLAAVVMGLITASVTQLHVLVIILVSGMVYGAVFILLALLFKKMSWWAA